MPGGQQSAQGEARHRERSVIEAYNNPLFFYHNGFGWWSHLPLVACARKNRKAPWAPVVSPRPGGCRARGQGIHEEMLSPRRPSSLHPYRQETPVVCVCRCPPRACITVSSVGVWRGCCA